MQPRQPELQQRLKGFLIRCSPSCARDNIFQKSTHRNHTNKKCHSLNSTPSGGHRTSQGGHGFLCLPGNVTLLGERRRDTQGRTFTLVHSSRRWPAFLSEPGVFPGKEQQCHVPWSRGNAAAAGDTADSWRTRGEQLLAPRNTTATLVLPSEPALCQPFPQIQSAPR